MEAASNAVGRKLLEGWTMHSQACDECLAPLMSHGAATPQCVYTGCSVCPSFSASSAASASPSTASSSSSPASTRSSPQPLSSSRQRHRRQQDRGDQDDGGSSGGGGGGGGGGEVLRRAKDRLRFALAKKLHAATTSLMEAGDAKEGLAACEVLCRLGEAADALDA